MRKNAVCRCVAVAALLLSCEISADEKGFPFVLTKASSTTGFWDNWALVMPDGAAGWLTLSAPDGKPQGELWTVGGGKLLSEVSLDADTLTFVRRVRVGEPEYQGGPPTGSRVACRHSATTAVSPGTPTRR